jgi:hypothetical protein
MYEHMFGKSYRQHFDNKEKHMQDKVAAFVKDNLVPKQFKTGSTGYYAGGKIADGGKRYQVSLSVVEIGSKPA